MKQMKTVGIMFALWIAAIIPAGAQTFSEWFSQKKTQKKYLAEQIAALEVYKEFLKEGYSIVSGGLGAINNIRHGEFDLHNDFFDRLLGISPPLQHYAKVADIMAMQLTILKIKDESMGNVYASMVFNAEEQEYIGRVFSRLLDGCTGTIDELLTLTTASRLGLTDDQRMKRIDQLYLDMQDQKTFAEEFSLETAQLFRSRLKERREARGLSNVYGLDAIQ